MSYPARRDGLAYREDYFDDASGWHAVKQLLRDIFDVDIDPIDLYGGHDKSSMACAWLDPAGTVIGNLSSFSMPLMINGRKVNAAGWQSGAVRPEYRGQGLFRDLILRQIERCETAGYEAVVLLTDKPALYQPHGFSILPTHLFHAFAPEDGTREQSRRLDVCNAADAALISALLAKRTPVSHQFAVIDQSRMFQLNCHLLDNLHLDFLPESGAIVVWRQDDDGATELLDVVGPDIPSLETISASLGFSGQTIRIGFMPDRLSTEVDVKPDTGDMVFMMRGPESMRPTSPFCLSPMAEF